MNKLVSGLASVPAEAIAPTYEAVKEKAPERATRLIIGVRLQLVHLWLKLSLIGIAASCYSNPIKWFSSLRYLIQLRRKFLGDHQLQKMALIDGKYYMGLYTPGWNSAVYKDFIRAQLNDNLEMKCHTNRFNTVFMAVTKKCALQCEHCYEWDNLNKKDVLSSAKLSAMVAKLQEQGVSQIQLSGGEPLLKMEVLLQVLKGARKNTDFWVVTSGFKLTDKNAASLKQAGLTGVIVSLDHFNPEEHNRFRGFKDAYAWVERAVQNAKKHKLVVALSLCATREFISEKNMMLYMDLAKNLGVAFVQLLEPKAVGHFAGKDVLLQPYHFSVLEAFFERVNFDAKYAAYPIVTYHGYYQRKFGCFSAGVKGMYVDTNGDMNACPFCHNKSGNLLDEDFEGNLSAMVSKGCSSYSTN